MDDYDPFLSALYCIFCQMKGEEGGEKENSIIVCATINHPQHGPRSNRLCCSLNLDIHSQERQLHPTLSMEFNYISRSKSVGQSVGWSIGFFFL